MNNETKYIEQPANRTCSRPALLCACKYTAIALAIAWLLPPNDCQAGTIAVPNYSFESPVVPPVSPYASPSFDSWQKTPQPAWYIPSQNHDTPWDTLMGEFYNVQFPGSFIDNCDGSQAAFLFALPDVGLFQDYDSVSGTNAVPSHAFNAKFKVGDSYALTVAVLGGGGSMKPGVTLQLGLYYRDASSNAITVASTTITNSSALFPTNTHFVDFSVFLPQVKASDPWAGQNIGIQLLSTVGFDLAGGYWDVDNVRLQTPAVILGNVGLTNGTFSLTVQGAPGSVFEVQGTTNINPGATWISLGTFTNKTGVASFTDSAAKSNSRFYRARQL